ncbi:MAG: hypothetical protein HXS50_00415 [Theionarchaea archaeon]|nr:hypothetical protein [Theionarchaea archaeon]
MGTISDFELALGPTVEEDGRVFQWMRITFAGNLGFVVWLLSESYPSTNSSTAVEMVRRYILEDPEGTAIEFRNSTSGEPVLPSIGTWKYLLPRSRGNDIRATVDLLGHAYELQLEGKEVVEPPEPDKVLDLNPDVLIGPSSNRRQVDETRRWDDSDYEMIPLVEEDYLHMVDAGINLFRVEKDQAEWIKDLGVFYWGIPGGQLDYPLDLYRSNYLGPALYLDEPAVVTRDHVLRPKLDGDEDFRRDITPEKALEEFEKYFRRVKSEGSPIRLLSQLREREDIDTGDMDFRQENVYTWETMVSTAALQLTEGSGPPKTVVFEPPGRIGTMRTLPEMNMAYGCQIPVDDPKNLASIIYGFLRGAARIAGGSWGMSVYGQFHRTDAFWFQTHAYDLGARLFLYWDNYQLACVPFGEYLALTRNLRNHVENHPSRNLVELREAAEVAILLPQGYNLGHVHMGRGLLWGIEELNLERRNRRGITYREVMGNFFAEIERCIRLGVSFDLIWDLEGLDISGYREVVRVADDGSVEVLEGNRISRLAGPRIPTRPAGTPPSLGIRVEDRGSGRFTARAEIRVGSSQVYYTMGAGKDGVYENTLVCWELYGPEEYDYRYLHWDRPELRIASEGDISSVEVDFTVERPGEYRLRASVCDLAGRTAVDWAEFSAK